MSSSLRREDIGLFKAPLGAVAGVLDLEAELGELVADEVGGGPVLGGLGIGAHLEQQVYGSGVSLGVAPVAALGGHADAENVLKESLEGDAQGLEVVARKGLVAVSSGVDDAAGVEEVRDDLRGVEVIVHGLGTEAHVVGHVDSGFLGRHQGLETAIALEHLAQGLLGAYQGVVAEVDGGAVVGLQDEETDDHRGEWLAEQRVVAREEVLQGDEVVVALAHLLAGDGDHVVVHPGVHGGVPLGGDTLCNLALVVREDEVEASAVDVELVAEVLAAHGRALEVPAGEAVGPGGGPAHDVLGCGLLPQGEVQGAALLVLSVECAGGGEQVVDVAAREDAVAVVGVIFAHVEVDGAVGDVGIAGVENPLDVLDLLDDVAGGVGLDAGGEHVQSLHVAMVAVEVELHHLHRLELLEAGLLGNLVLAGVGVVLQVADVGYVAHVAHLVAQVGEVAEQDVEGDGGAGMAQVGVAVDGRPAHVHSHAPRVQRAKPLLRVRQRII